MSIIKYFPKHTSFDIKCDCKGKLFFDEKTTNILTKKYGTLTRASIESWLMSSYQNRKANLNNVIVTKNGKIYKDFQHIGTIIGCECDEIKDNNVIDNNVYPNVISISGIWTWGIWHFPTESLSALMSTKMPSDAKIHVHTKTKYVLYWLSLIGISQDRVIDGNIRATNLLIPELGACGSPYPEQITWLNNIVRSSVNATSDKLLILSKRTHSRQLKNYQEVYEASYKLAVKMGLKLYIHDDSKLPSIKEQHSAFKSASIIIAPHGGGNINILAMSEGTDFIEIMDSSWPNNCFLRVAAYLNINYYGVHSENYIVNIDSLQNVCKKLSNNKTK